MQINLWECLTSQRITYKREDRGPAVTDEALAQLGRAARFGGQELSVEATDEGWLIEVFSCHDSDYKVQVLVTKDGPIKVLKDRVGRVEYHH